MTRIRALLVALIALALAALACGLPAASPTAVSVPPTRTPAPSPMLPPTATPRPSPAPTETPLPSPTLLPLIGAEGAGDAYFPTMGNGGYDALHYTLDLTVDLEAHTLDATAILDAQAAQDLARFNLDLVGMQVEGVAVNGQPAHYERSRGELIITPADLIGVGETFRVWVDYHGTPRGQADMPDYSQGWHFYEGGAFVAGEPTGASGWYPVNMHPSDKATYTFRVTVEKPYEVAANGTLRQSIDNGSTQTFVWESRDPIAPYLVTVGVGDFRIETDASTSGVPIRNYIAASLSSDVIQATALQADMIDVYESLFGPYPFEVSGVIVHDVRLQFALETQTLIVFGNSFIDEYVVAHELAHMWFGDSVTPARWQDIWLNEGFATYASLLWFERAYSPKDAEQELRSMYEVMAGSGGNTIVIGDPGPDDMFDGAVYLRGALTLHALRLRVGDEVFFGVLRTYADRYRHGNAATEDFIALAEEVSGESLDDLFQRWLYEAKMPDIPEMGLYAKDFAP